MGRFALVENATWSDPDFVKLSTDARLLFIWSWTNPGATICGLYHASERQLRRALSPEASEAQLRTALNYLAVKPLLLYDPEAEVVYVVNRAKYANRSPKVAVRMQREVEAVPPSPLVERFVTDWGNDLNLRLVEA